eukprot:10629747-Prorocentrum_lima.AAC.1
MISRQPTTTNDLEEGTYYVGQGHYVLEVLERFSSSMHYKPRSTPGEPESFFQEQADGNIVPAQLQHQGRAW